MGSLASSTSSSQPSPTRHGIDQLALNMGFGGIKPSIAQPPSPSSLVNTTLVPPHPQPVAIQSFDSQTSLHSTDNISIGRKPSPEIDGDVEERVITKVDPIEMTAKTTTEIVQKDSTRRAALLLNGPKFELNSNEISKGEMKIDTDTIYPVAVSGNPPFWTFFLDNDDFDASLDRCRSDFTALHLMETDFLVFLRNIGRRTVRCSYVLHLGSNVYHKESRGDSRGRMGRFSCSGSHVG